MITKITSANANQYRALFAKATQDLRTHDANGKKSGEQGYSGSPVISAAPSYLPIDITAAEYVAGEVAVKRDGEWVMTSISDPYLDNAEYAIEIVDGEITSLEEYFQYIADLKNINPTYTILPIDEEIFKIDADSRKITIPAAFAANGVSVQGDEISEVLYFSINRFYDMEDLTNDEIFIEWRCPANADGEVIEGVSKPWAIDVESHPGYIVFGWPLASEITAVPGDVTFSVRFYRFAEEEHTVQYSLSTLTNTVTIKPGIDLKNTVRQNLETPGAITDSTELLNERIINSEASGAGETPAYPEFDVKEHLMEGSKGDIVIATKDNGNYQFYSFVPKANTVAKKYDEYLVYLTNPETGVEGDGIYRIRSTVSDTGAITYAWIKMSENGLVLNNTLFDNGLVFIETADTTFVENRVYYVKGGTESEPTYTPYTGSTVIVDDDEQESPANPSDLTIGETKHVHLYEKWGQSDIESVGTTDRVPTDNNDFVRGTYQPRITNRLGRRTERKYGPVVRVTGPEQPIIVDDLIPKNPDGTYKWSNGEGKIGGAIFEDGEDGLVAPLKVKAQIDAHGYTKFVWYKQVIDEDPATPDWVEIGHSNVATRETIEGIDPDDRQLATSQLFNIVGTEYGADDNGDGIYKCVVDTLLNADHKVNPEAEGLAGADPEVLVRVTHAASPAILDQETLIEQKLTVNVGDFMPIGLAPNENEVRTEDDYYEYQWYRYVAVDANTTNRDKGLAAQGRYTDPASIVRDQKLEGRGGIIDTVPEHTENKLDSQGRLPIATIPNTPGLNDNGQYYCIITNHYNGSTCVQSTNFIENLDIADQG